MSESIVTDVPVREAPLERAATLGLLLLPVVAAWGFVPQLPNAFQVKQPIVIVGAIALALLLFCSRSTVVVPKGSTGVALGVWLTAVLVSGIYAPTSPLVLEPLLTMIALVLLACLLGSANLDKMQRTAEAAILIAATGVALFALKQYSLPQVFDPGFHALGKMAIYSTLGNPSLAALSIVVAVPCAVFRFLTSRGWSRVGYAAVVVTLAGGLLVTQARLVWAAVGVMSVVALLWLGSAATRRITLSALAVSVVAVVSMLFYIDLPAGVIHSLKARAFIWLTSYEMMRDNWTTGVGLGHFGLEHMRYQAQLFASGSYADYSDNAAVISEAHNELLNWGATAGVFALLGFALVCLSMLWYGWRSVALKTVAPHFYLAMVGYLFAMLFIALLSYPVPALLFWLLFGVVLARSAVPRSVVRIGSRSRPVVALLAIILIVASSYRAWQEVRSGVYEARGDRLLEQHDAWLAAKEYQRAVSWYPYRGELRKKTATALFVEGQLDLALAELTEAKRYSGDLGILLLEGEVLARRGDLERAAASYQHIAAAFPNLVTAHFILGQIYRLQGKVTMAEAEFRRVLEITPAPFNLNLTSDKVELQKQLVRDYFREGVEPQDAATATSP